MNVPQASNVAEKGASSDGGALGGGQDIGGVGTGVPSAFAGGFASSPLAPDYSSFTLFGEAVALLCSDDFVNLSEEEQARVLSSQDRRTHLRLVTVSNNLRTAMPSESRVSRKRSRVMEGDALPMQFELDASKLEIETLRREKQAHEEARQRVLELERQVAEIQEEIVNLDGELGGIEARHEEDIED